MAKQQRLPFEWQGPGQSESDDVRIRPVEADAAQQHAGHFELEADGMPVPDTPEEPARRAPVVRVRFAQKSVEEQLEEAEMGDDDVPMNLGQVLVDARSREGLSIADVSDRTKVPPQFIEAAENERFQEFPADLYARGHLAKLCAAYKIPAGPVMKLYRAAVGSDVPAGGRHSLATGSPIPAAGGKLELSQYRPVIQTQSASSGVGHRLTTTIALGALVLIVGVVIAAFAITQYRNWRLNREDDSLGIDPNATSGLAIEEFIVPQPLPLKEIPVPD